MISFREYLREEWKYSELGRVSGDAHGHGKDSWVQILHGTQTTPTGRIAHALFMKSPISNKERMIDTNHSILNKEIVQKYKNDIVS